MGAILPFLLMAGGKGKGLFGGGMIKKVLMYTLLGPMALMLGGGFNIMDFLLIPKIAPMFSSILGGILPGGGGGTPNATPSPFAL